VIEREQALAEVLGSARLAVDALAKRAAAGELPHPASSPRAA